MVEANGLPARAGGLSLKARLAGVLLLASLPGIILGGIEARRAYSSASHAEELAITQTAQQIANRSEEVITGALILAESLAQATPVRIGSTSCEAILTSAATQSSRFASISRLDRSGRVLCSSATSAVGTTLGDAPWFAQARSADRPTVSPAWRALPSGEQVIPLNDPILLRDRTTGLVVVFLRATWLITQAASDLEGDETSIVLFDGSGAPFAVAARGAPQADVVAAARSALAGQRGRFAPLQTGVASISGGGLHVVVVAPTEAGAIGARAALITAAPLIAVIFAMAAVWIALHWWVVRWIDGLVVSARSVLQGRYSSVDLTGAPDELRVLGAAFHDAVTKAGQRAIELGVELARNTALTRELHHRVKNNIQVFMSGLSRQLRRTEEPTVRYALSEARARMLPIALTYRYAVNPSDVTLIDLAAYLTELARQVHASLDGSARGVDLSVECDPLSVSSEQATTIGALAGECLTSAYLSSSGMSTTDVRVSLRRYDEFAILECGVLRPNPSHGASKLDEPLIRQLANQMGGEITIDIGPRVTLRWPLQRIERAALVESETKTS